MDKSFTVPDEIWDLSVSERELRAQVDQDFCRLDDRYFLRGVAFIPIKETDDYFGWGIRAEVPENQFWLYIENFEFDNSSQPRFPGVAANQISAYPNTLGLNLQVQLGNQTQRPAFYFSEPSHQLTIDQRLGVSLGKAYRFSG